MTPLPDISSGYLVRAIEAQYDVCITSPPKSLPSGFHSRAWIVTTARERWIVKLSDPISDPIPKLERQIHLSNYLNQHAIRAPQILELRDGGFIATVIINEHHYPLQLMRYEIRNRIQPERASDATLVLAGELVADLHQALDHYPERDDFIADLHKSANEWGARDEGLWPLLQDLPDLSLMPHGEQIWFRSIDQRALAYVQQQYPAPVDLSMALLHGDLNFEHIQFLADGTPYLFDFGDMCWGPIAHELAVFFLNVFCDSEVSFPEWEAMRQRILIGYSAKRPVSYLDQARILVFVVNRVVAQAEYAVELASEGRMEIDWTGLKRTYQLAEYLLNQAEGE
jgi:Ser/Thr protein kinase RdoA (MazF antagonist)